MNYKITITLTIDRDNERDALDALDDAIAYLPGTDVSIEVKPEITEEAEK